MRMRFRDWPLGLKLLAGPALAMALIATAAAVGYVALVSQHDRLEAQMHAYQARLRIAADLRVSLVRSDLALLQAQIAGTEGMRVAAEAHVGRVATLAADIDPGATAPDEAALLAAMRDRAREYVAAAAAADLAERARRRADTEAAILNWRSYHIAVGSDAAEEEAEAALARSVWFGVVAAAGMAFAIATALSLVIGHGISSAMRRAADILTRLASGDSGVEIIATDRADEVGRLLHAAAVFKSNVRELERVAAERADLEAQNRAELQVQFDRLAQSEQRLRDIASAASDWFWETDAEDRLVMVSGRFFEVTGFMPEYVLGSTRLSFALRAQSQEDAEKWVAYAKNVAARRGFRNLDYSIKATDGRVVHVRSNGVPVFVGEEFVGYRGASSDVSALVDAQREALQSSRLASVGQLAAGIAHEINTPIQYVGDNLRFFEGAFSDLARGVAAAQEAVADDPGRAARVAQALEDADVPYLLEELPTAVKQSLDGVDHVARIVRSMKEFSHPGSTAKVMTDINRAIESMLTVTTNEWKHTATVEKDLADDLPKILCLPADVNQVLLNLMVNASQALEGRGAPGLIRVSTRRDGNAVEIRIADNGPGIPESLRERVFDPFFTTKPVGKGTGQGLAIAMDVVVKKHGGRLTLEETPGGGATFVVRLPIAQEVGASADETLDSVRR